MWDGQLIKENALLYNEPDSLIVKDATFVYNMLQALVKRAQRPSRHVPKALAENDDIVAPSQRSSRKAKRPVIESSEEENEDFSEITTKRKSRRISNNRFPV